LSNTLLVSFAAKNAKNTKKGCLYQLYTPFILYAIHPTGENSKWRINLELFQYSTIAINFAFFAFFAAKS